MKKVLALVSSLLLVAAFAAPAQSAGAKYSVHQKTLAAFSSSATGLTSQQKAQIKATVQANPDAEKFICTGIRYYDQPMSVNITVRKRAKAACEYAKQLNPALSTWYQNKPTKARSYSGKVLLTVKSPISQTVTAPTDVEICKVKDGLPQELLAVGRGSYYQGVKARGPVGFPWVSSHFLPSEGNQKFLMMLVSFEDTKKFVDKPQSYWGPQGDKLAGWFDYWSQGKVSLDIDTVENWIDLPYASSKAPFNDAQLTRDIINRLPSGLDPNDYDALFIQWAPGVKEGTRNRFKLALNSIDTRDALDFEYDPLIWSTSLDFYQQDYEVRRDNIWGSLVHELLHEMNLNLHGPGNGWGTGVGQSYRANQNGGVSYAISAWEQFLLGWMPDSQVHCVDPQTLDGGQTAVLTPLEIAGGNKKAIVIPISDSDVLVIESRRPVGYSESWDSKNRGLLAYTVNPQEAAQRDHIDEDCGNDPTHTKWAYYLFPDQEREDASAWCGAMGGVFTPAVFNTGETLTHNGVHVELVSSFTNKDVVKVTKADGEYTPPPGFPYLGPPAPNGGWWNQCEGGDCPLELPNPAENFGYKLNTSQNSVPKVSSCEALSRQHGFRNGIAASRKFKEDAGAAVAALVSTQWYAKNRELDTNLDGVICSCQAPESGSIGDASNECVTSQLRGPGANTSSLVPGDYPFEHFSSVSTQKFTTTRSQRLGLSGSCSCCG